jgi:hypothetical protein
MQHFVATGETKERTTCVSFVVFLQPHKNVTESTESFIEIYGQKGRILV